MPGYGQIQFISVTAAAWAAAAVTFCAFTPCTSARDDAPDPNETLAEVAETELELAGPGDLPGREPGARVRPAPQPVPAEPTEPSESAREWFGESPYWEWSRATGDWAGARTGLEDVGLTFAGSYTFEWSSVWSGGVRNRASSRSLLDLNLTLDTAAAFGLPGGSAFIDFQSSDMRGGPEDTGAFMASSSIETGDNIDQISELWYQQLFAEGLIRVKAGKIDAGLEFGYTTAAENFLHQSNVFLFTNGLVPTYPDPAMGALVFVSPTDHVYIGGGFFDGSLSEGVHTGRLGPKPLFDGDDYLWIAEAGLTWETLGSFGPGKVAVGGWGHTGEFEKPDGTFADGAGAGYVIFEQRLLARENADPQGDGGDGGLIAFISAGFADGDVSDAQTQVTAGLTLIGTFEGRDDDAAGVLVTWLDLSNRRGFVENETALELMYKLRLTPFASIIPSLQYIANPSGDPTIDDAVVGVVQFEVEF